MSVYFVKCNEYIKVGHSSDPVNRVYSMQTGNPYQLEIDLIIPGDMDTESFFHSQFSKQRYRGEWFVHDDYIASAISDLRDIFGEYSDSIIGEDLISMQDDPPPDAEDYDSNLISPNGKKASVIRKLIEAHPNRSDIDIAEEAECSRMYVWSIRNNRLTS